MVNHAGKKYLASGSDHGCSSIVLWDTSTWNMRMRIESHRAAVTGIVDLQDGRGLVSGSYDKTINVYSLANDGKLAYNLPANKTSVTALLLNCNASKMISCGLDDTLSIWQLVRGNSGAVETMFLERIIQNNTMVCSLVASALRPELVLLGAKDGKVKVIDIDRGQAGKSLSVCSNAVIEMVVIERATKPCNCFFIKNCPS
jgi:WD40 repeat protein